jgi:hypothetical protein
LTQRESVDMNNVISRAVRAGTRASSRVMSRPVSASPTCGPTAFCLLFLASYLLYLGLLPPAYGLLLSCLLPPAPYRLPTASWPPASWSPSLLPPALVSPVCRLLPAAPCPLFSCLLQSKLASGPLAFWSLSSCVARAYRVTALTALNPSVPLQVP